VTLLGDAIHAMSPARGSGANTALMDAANLCAALTAGGDLVEAIGRYEKKVRDYGFAAVEASRQAGDGNKPAGEPAVALGLQSPTEATPPPRSGALISARVRGCGPDVSVRSVTLWDRSCRARTAAEADTARPAQLMGRRPGSGNRWDREDASTGSLC
jgi:hypothetical protein